MIYGYMSEIWVYVRNMGIPWKDKQRQKKLAIATWSVSKAVVTAKPNKTNLQAGQEKLRQSRPDKPQPQGLTDTVQSL